MVFVLFLPKDEEYLVKLNKIYSFILRVQKPLQAKVIEVVLRG